MGARFNKIKPGITMYDIKKAGKHTRVESGGKWLVFPVYVREVDAKNSRVLASYNGRTPTWFSREQITKFRRELPKKMIAWENVEGAKK